MFYWVLIIAALVGILVLIAYLKNKQARKRKIAKIKAKWGKPTDDKRDTNLISIYLKATNKLAGITPSTADDLDLKNVFDYIDRTNSKPGQQYLYNKLHNPETSATALLEMDEKIETLSKDRAMQEQVELQLSKLNATNAYYLPELFVKEQLPLFSPLLTFYIQVSGITVITLAILLTIMVSQVYFIALLSLIILNTIIHYKNKGKIAQYTHSLPQVVILNKAGKWLFKNVAVNRNDTVKISLNKIDKLKRSLLFVNFEVGVAVDPTDIFASIFELIKTVLLLESMMFINSLKQVNKYRADIEVVYKYVAEIDMLIAIDSVRIGLPYYSKPTFITDDNNLGVKELYHPLVKNCVPNSMRSSADKGILITGSNMSGKTTFIRAMAINTLLAQTIFTCCAKLYEAPLLNIHTSIRVNDDIEEHKSYFQAEALSVLDIVKQCGIENPLRSLVIIDEIFRGTNTIERIAAAKSVLSYLTANRNFVFVSTHDLELAELLGEEYTIYSFEELVADKRLVFDYKIKEGLLKNKNGIAILEGLGYPSSLITDAYNVSDQLRQKYLL